MNASLTASPWRVGDASHTIFGAPNGNPSPKTVARVVGSRADAQLLAAAPALLEAIKLLQAALTEHQLRDVKKRFSLCVADAAASKAVASAEGR